MVYVFADQWRAEATGYAGNKDVRTPHLDRLAGESVNFANAVSCCPVCCPYRASLLTGQYPLTHGVFLNDVPLRRARRSPSPRCTSGPATKPLTSANGTWTATSAARSFRASGGRDSSSGRSLDCTHAYNNSFYYGDENVRLKWDGYDAIAQTREAQQYIRDHAGGPPFLLVLSWGPPHDPYGTAPRSTETFSSLPVSA